MIPSRTAVWRFLHQNNDSTKKLVLFTEGKVGNPSQRLADMLRYIEKSTDKNVVNKDLETIQKLWYFLVQAIFYLYPIAGKEAKYDSKNVQQWKL